MISPKTSKCSRARRNLRELIDAIIWVLRTGSPWCALPKKYSSYHTVYNNFREWSQEGVIAKIFEKFAPNQQETSQIQIDATYVKAHQELKKGVLGKAIGKSNGGLTSKIHTVTDGNGQAMNFIITGGNTHDCTQAKNLINSIIHKDMYILADRSYDANKIIEYITFNSAIAVIPSRKNRKVQRNYDKEVYKNCNQIERFFNKPKQFRRIATKYDKLSSSFLSLIFRNCLSLLPTIFRAIVLKQNIFYYK